MDRQCPSCGGFCKKSGCERENVEPKKEWQGLTEEDLEDVFPAIVTYTDSAKSLYRSIARAVEAKLREKNHVG